MSADEALVAFARICSSVLEDDNYSPVVRASKLEDEMKSILKEHGLSSETTLVDTANPPTCKL